MHFIDYSLVIIYLVVLLVLGLIKSTRKNESAAELIIGGRGLPMPGFVMWLV